METRRQGKETKSRASTLTTRAEAPKDFGGRFWRNFERTTPELPWARVTRPQMTRTFEPLTAFWAL